MIRTLIVALLLGVTLGGDCVVDEDTWSMNCEDLNINLSGNGIKSISFRVQRCSGETPSGSKCVGEPTKLIMDAVTLQDNKEVCTLPILVHLQGTRHRFGCVGNRTGRQN